mgnify:CR=1 FL=1
MPTTRYKCISSCFVSPSLSLSLARALSLFEYKSRIYFSINCKISNIPWEYKYIDTISMFVYVCIHHHKILSINSSISYISKEERWRRRRIIKINITSSYRMQCSRSTDHDGVTHSKAHTYWLKYVSTKQPHKSLEKSYYVKKIEKEEKKSKLMILTYRLYMNRKIYYKKKFVFEHILFVSFVHLTIYMYV